MAYIGAGITRFNTADDLTVTDDAEIKGELSVDGAVDLNTSLNVDGTVTADGLTVDGDVEVTGKPTVLNTSEYIQLQDLNSAVVSGTNMGGIEWRTADSNVSGANRITARIRAEGEGTFINPDNAPTKLIFSTHTTSGVDPVDRMVIANNGDISFYEDDGSTVGLFWDASNGTIDVTSGGTVPDASTAGQRIGIPGTVVPRSSCGAFTSAVSHLQFYNGNGGVGSISTSGSSTSFTTSSDYRLKENVVDMTGAIDRVKALPVRRFNFIVDPDTTVDGFLAHEAQEIVPESVTGEKDEVEAIGNFTNAEGVVVQEGVTEPSELPEEQTWIKTGERPVMQGIDQAKLVPLLTGALKEAIAKIESLEARIEALEAN